MKLITKAEFARIQNLSKARITQLSEQDSLPFDTKIAKIIRDETIHRI